MVAFNKINDFVERLGLAEHNLNTDTLRVYLSNEAPLASDTVKSDIAEISAGNGYTAGGIDTQNAWSETSGVASMTGVDAVWTASGGSIGPFRYVVFYNDTHASDRLIGWWDYGSSITLNAGDSFTVDFAATIMTLQ
jgi:hypothetical protein